MKSQGVRLLDVWLFGPFMVWAGAQQRSPFPAWARLALMVGGALTIVYNARNYLEAER